MQVLQKKKKNHQKVWQYVQKNHYFKSNLSENKWCIVWLINIIRK